MTSARLKTRQQDGPAASAHIVAQAHLSFCAAPLEIGLLRTRLELVDPPRKQAAAAGLMRLPQPTRDRGHQKAQYSANGGDVSAALPMRDGMTQAEANDV